MDRKAAIEAAQEHIIRVLESDRFVDMNIGRDDNDLWELLLDLTSTRDEMMSLGSRMQRDIASAVDYVSGKPGSFNSLGILQADGPRFDALAMKFYTLTGLVKKALVRYYEAQ
jgi:hypothetical protein